MSNKQSAVRILADAKGHTIIASIGTFVGGKHPFVVTYPKEQPLPEEITTNTSITFSLQKWAGSTPPGFGQIVELLDVTKYPGGWRAASARPVTPASAKQ